MDNIPESLKAELTPQRLHEVVHCLDLENLKMSTLSNSNSAIIGFCSDLGVLRNQGRPGAAEAPPQIRKQLVNKALHNSNLNICDVGDVVLTQDEVNEEDVPSIQMNSQELKHKEDILDPLKKAQVLLAQKISNLLKQNLFTIILGGGHEVAKPHFDALRETYPDKKIGIINIDAHFDLRQDLLAPTSGTSFYEIWQQTMQATGHDNSKEFHYLVIGIQPSSNTPLLYKTAYESNSRFIVADEIPISGLNVKQQKLVNTFIDKVDVIMLTVCMDVFQSAISPGVSAPSPNGLTPKQVIPLIKEIMKSGKIISMDIAEVNPALDENQKTAVLAAEICYQLLTDLKWLKT